MIFCHVPAAGEATRTPGCGYVVDDGDDLDGLSAGGSAVDLEREIQIAVRVDGRVGGA